MSRNRVAFRPATDSDLAAVISWIGSESECTAWAGPAVSYPIFTQNLKAQIEYRTDNSFCLAQEDRLAAFGQLLRRERRRFHLARIIVAPECRGRGFGAEICRRLIARANGLKSDTLTLNVYRDNPAAVRLYRKMGFEPAAAPDGAALPPDVVHMRLQP